MQTSGLITEDDYQKWCGDWRRDYWIDEEWMSLDFETEGEAMDFAFSQGKTPPPDLDSILEINRYVERGHRPGSFIQGILCNDLFRTFQSAHPLIRCRIKGILIYVYNHIPSECWGSYDAFDRWIETHNNKGGHNE